MNTKKIKKFLKIKNERKKLNLDCSKVQSKLDELVNNSIFSFNKI